MRTDPPGHRLYDAASAAADAATVDALCRLQLAARRAGTSVRLANASPELVELIAFMGLADVLTVASDS